MEEVTDGYDNLYKLREELIILLFPENDNRPTFGFRIDEAEWEDEITNNIVKRNQNELLNRRPLPQLQVTTLSSNVQERIDDLFTSFS